MNALSHRCRKCKHIAVGYFDKCPRCQSWNSAEAFFPETSETRAADAPTAVPLAAFEGQHFNRLATGIVPLDLALGGGFVPGTTTIFFGDPGSGKTTLALQAGFALSFNSAPYAARPALDLSNEQAAAEILDLAKRLNLGVPYLWFANPADFETVRRYVASYGAPACIIIDSLQEFYDSANPSKNHLANFVDFVDYVQAIGSIGIMVSQVNAGGGVHGGKRYEHKVNAAIRFRQIKGADTRELWIKKNRSGRAQFSVHMEMTAGGLV
jgi:DNA repair protein RadA/Sms